MWGLLHQNDNVLVPEILVALASKLLVSPPLEPFVRRVLSDSRRRRRRISPEKRREGSLKITSLPSP
jgi:hypothetical protein